MTDNVSIILARSGSKGIPQKNIKQFCEKPLVAWTIEHSLSSEKIDSVWVSSDCPNILALSETYGAGAILRPEELSGDEASSESGWLHAVKFLEENGHDIGLILAPQCTSPVRESTDFDRAITYFQKNKLDSLFSATLATDFNIWRRDHNNTLHSFTYDYKNRGRRQEKQAQWHENGSFWIFTPSILAEQNNRLGGNIGMFQMEHWKSFQIDDPADFAFCETIMKQYLSKQLPPLPT